MIPILFRPDADPEALIDVNSIPLEDVNSEQLLATGDYTSARNFTTLGLGKLTDCISCEVYEERNGEYELTMEYPMDGVHFSEIENRSIIWAKPNYTDDPQAFRVYQITSPIDGVIEVNAAHISYDLSGVPVKPFTATSCSAACAGLMTNAMISNPFSIGTTVPTIADFNVAYPTSARSLFGGMEGSLLDVYGGEWAYDNYTCTLKSARGQNRGVVIRYGKNLLDLRQEANIENVYTGVLAYWKNEVLGQSVQTNIINVAGTFNYRKILVLDLSLEFTDKPTKAQLTAKAQSYMTQNNIGRPNVNITLDWVQVGELTDRVDLCDTVTVIFEKLGIETTAKCISTRWDVLAERYTELEIGDAKANMPSTIAGLQETEKVLTTSVTPSMQRAINNATALITGNSGGYVVMHDGDGDGYPDELLIMDTPDINTATKVWRWNQNGLGYSASGYSGTFGLAMTANGEIVADFITTGTLSADRILGGTLKLGGTDNGNGVLQIKDANGNVIVTGDKNGLGITAGSMDIEAATYDTDIVSVHNTDNGITYVDNMTARRLYMAQLDSGGNETVRAWVSPTANGFRNQNVATGAYVSMSYGSITMNDGTNTVFSVVGGGVQAESVSANNVSVTFWALGAKTIYVTFPHTYDSLLIFGEYSNSSVLDLICSRNTSAPNVFHFGSATAITAARLGNTSVTITLPASYEVTMIAPPGTTIS